MLGGVSAGPSARVACVLRVASSAVLRARAGRALLRWFSERGVGPRLDVLSLDDIDRLLPVSGVVAGTLPLS